MYTPSALQALNIIRGGERMKKRILVILLVFAIATGLVFYSVSKAKRPYYPEPTRNPEIPSYVIWNPDKGEYYNGLDFAWDAEKNRYVTKDMPKSIESPFPAWLEEHKNSTDIVDKAIIEYKNSKTKTVCKQIFRSYYNPFEDEELKIITDLGIKNIPQMFKK